MKGADLPASLPESDSRYTIVCDIMMIRSSLSAVSSIRVGLMYSSGKRCILYSSLHCSRGLSTDVNTAELDAASSSSVSGHEVDDSTKEMVVINVAKKNIKQSPWKMNFLIKLARNQWLPEALAQLKFTPKRRAPEVTTLLNRAASVAKIYHGLIPEELHVKEIFVTKGFMFKRMRIMGRGRTGVGYKRYTHMRAIVEQIDFEAKIASCKSTNQKKKWIKRKEMVEQLKPFLPLTLDDVKEEAKPSE